MEACIIPGKQCPTNDDLIEEVPRFNSGSTGNARSEAVSTRLAREIAAGDGGDSCFDDAGRLSIGAS